MDKNTIKQLILSAQEREIKLVERNTKLNFVKKINAIIGPRRAGKTFFIYQNINHLKKANLKDRIVYINFEDERLFPIKKEDLEIIIESYYELYPENKNKKVYMFFDEIQVAPLWQLFIRRIQDQENIEICITGSSSKLLSKEIATELRGRTLSYFIFPYSFKEFINAKDIKLGKNFEYKKPLIYKIKNLLKEYINFGGFPEITDKEIQLKTKILQEYFDLIFYKDLIERHKIRNSDLIKEMLLYLISNFSSYLSINKYYNTLISQSKKISKNTVFEYISYISDINLIFLISKYGKLKEQFVNPKKIYLIDTGLINAIAFKTSRDMGKLYENLVLLELKRKEKEVYYWKDNYECDFIIKEKTRITEAIQVCYELNNENKPREINGLIEALEKFNLKQGIIITEDYEAKEKNQNKTIQFIPLWKWLLK